jgi:NAD+ synthase
MNPTPDLQRLETAVVEEVLTRFLHQEIHRTGFRRGVISLSGGIDSALACYLTVAALGTEQVLALRLTDKTTSEKELSYAQLVVDDLSIPFETIPISAMVDPLFETSPGIDDHRRGNFVARVRMAITYDRSASWRGLVIGTSNKSDLLLGNGTLYGNLASAINPLGDLYKTQVRHLAQSVGVPQAIIANESSVNLISEQTDEGMSSFSYDEVDKLLHLMIDERYSAQELDTSGFEINFVHKIQSMVQGSHFKRNLPLIPKVSGRTIGHDFRYLRDARS